MGVHLALPGVYSYSYEVERDRHMYCHLKLYDPLG